MNTRDPAAAAAFTLRLLARRIIGLTSKASFAALCGVSPIEASSGKIYRRRLNRGGDRQANSALYTITITRLRWDTRTQDYAQRRIAEGKTRCEGIRRLKHYTARGIYRDITAARSASPPIVSAA